MITLAATDSIRATASANTAITSTLSGDEIVAGVDTFKTLDQRVLTTSIVSLYSPGTGNSALVKEWVLANTTASDVTVTLYRNGSAAANQTAQMTIPANGQAIRMTNGWQVYNSNGTPYISTTGTAGNKNVGNTVLDPGTGKLEIAYPNAGLVAGTNKTYVATDRGYTYRRSNSGSAMSDTLPALTNTTADIGYWISIYNQDTVVAAQLTMNASGGALFLSATGATSATSPINYGSRQSFIWDGTQWLLYAGNANLLRRSGTIIAGNFPQFVDSAGNATVDSGVSAATVNGKVASVAATDSSITVGGTATAPTISRAALTGDVTAPAGSNVTTVKNDVALGGNPTTTTQTASNNSTRIATTAYVDTADALKVPTSRILTTTAPITIDGGASANLSADRTLAVSDATFTSRGTMTAAEKITANTQDGRTSAGTNPRVFRPGDFMQGNVHDPTGGSTSTSFTAMMAAARAWNDRYEIELAAGVWKIDHDILKSFGTNNTSVTIRGPGRGNCILLPAAAPTGFQAMIAPNRNTTGGDSITLRGFTIYNTSGAVYTTGAGILTNGADAIDIQEVAFIDMYRDIQVSGEPHTMTTNGTTALTGISPAISAADTGQVISGPGIVPGSTITFVTSSTATLSVAATTSTTEVRYLNNTIKVSMQHIVNFNTNAGAANTSVGIYVNNGQAGDTYIGPDVVMSDGGGSTRRRACIELVETGHYEITQANLTGSQTGILMDPGASQSVAFGFHTNVLCDSNTVNGMLLDTLATTSSIKNIKSVNSWYSGTVNGGAPFNIGAAGVKTQATAAGTLNGFTFTTDRFLNNRTHGFEHGAGTDFRWSDCDMKGNSQIGSGTANGLNVAANIGNWSINGGKYGGTDAAPTGGNQGYGIFVAAGTGDNIKIGADSLAGNVTGPLSFGATGLNNFINGCPGLASPFFRGSSSAAIAATQTTVAVMQLPKNSLRVGSSFRLHANTTQAAAITAGTFQVRCGTTADALGAAASNAIVVAAVAPTGAANAYGHVEFIVTITAIGNGTGNIQGSGFGTLGTTAAAAPALAFGPLNNVPAANAGFIATLNTTADLYLSLSQAATASTLTARNAGIEVLSY